MKTKIITDVKSIDIVKEIRSGKIFVLPFDTVYGLVADPFDSDAVDKIYKIKGRDFAKPVALIFSSTKMLQKYISIDPEHRKFIHNKTPGAYTFILPWEKRSRLKFAKQYQGLKKIGVRIPDCKLILDIITELGQPIAATSANVSDQANCWSIPELVDQIRDQKNKPDFIIDSGVLPKNPPSLVIDISNLDSIKTLRS